MTNEQLTNKVIELEEAKAQCLVEQEYFRKTISALQEDVKTTKGLAEDVHIMAINMESMQKTLSETNKKVDTLANKEYKEYEENKKIIKDKVLSGLTGAGVTGAIGFIVYLITQYVSKGGA